MPAGDAGGSELLRQAASIVTAVVHNSSLVHAGSGGVLRELSEPTQLPLTNLYASHGGADALQFKAVLLRHLRYLIDIVVETTGGEAAAASAIKAAGGDLDEWHSLISTNAASIWDRAACIAPHAVAAPGSSLIVPPLFGGLWMGPCSWAFGGPTATTQSAAIDVFVAAIP